MIILRTGILYSIIICALISFSCLYSSFLISLKVRKTREDVSLTVFLNIFGIYWLIYMVMNVFGWLNMPSVYKPLSYSMNLILFLQPIPLLLYFVKSRTAAYICALYAFAAYALTLGQALKLTSATFWGIQCAVPPVPALMLILGSLAPLGILSAYNLIKDIRKPSKPLFIESIGLMFACLQIFEVASLKLTWQLLLFRMVYILIGFIAYFYLTGEEATIRFAQRISPRLGDLILRLRAARIPFFAKLLLLFVLLSVIPIAGAGILLFLTFKEIIDLYIYKPLLWNLKTSKEEFLVALGNVQVQALFLIMLTVILVVIGSSVASRAIAQSLKRIGLGMKKIEEGDLSQRVTPESNDEIGDLANYFNKMALEIKRSREIMENWNRELERTVAERTKDLQTLYNISKAMGSTLDLDEILKKSTAYIPPIGGSDALAIYLLDDDGTYRSRVAKGIPGDFSFKSGEGAFGQAVASEHIIRTADIKELSEKEKEALTRTGAGTVLLIPMENKGRKTGLIVIPVMKEHSLSNIELNLLSTIADQMAIAVENAGIYEKEKEAVKRLVDLDNMKTELISMVSHELRTPITSIKGFLSHFTAGTTGKMNDTQMKFLNIMNKESEHLLQLVDNLLEFSRLERGGLKVKSEKVDIDALVQGIVEAIEPQLTSRKVELTLSLKAGAAFLGDDMKIGQVIRNLIGNALKFTAENPGIDISTSVQDGKIEVRIRDNGIGMEKEQLESIFTKFYQADGSLTRKFGGMGLGLAISKEIIEAHGGRIWAESQGSGKGSTFIFELPVIK